MTQLHSKLDKTLLGRKNVKRRASKSSEDSNGKDVNIKKSQHSVIDPVSLCKAYEAVKAGIATETAAKRFSVPLSTLNNCIIELHEYYSRKSELDKTNSDINDGNKDCDKNDQSATVQHGDDKDVDITEKVHSDDRDECSEDLYDNHGEDSDIHLYDNVNIDDNPDESDTHKGYDNVNKDNNECETRTDILTDTNTACVVANKDPDFVADLDDNADDDSDDSDCVEDDGDLDYVDGSSDSDSVSENNDPDCVRENNDPDCVNENNDPDCESENNDPDGVSENNDPDCVSENNDPDCVSENNDPDSVSENNDPDSVSENNDPDCVSENNDPDCVNESNDPDCCDVSNEKHILQKNPIVPGCQSSEVNTPGEASGEDKKRIRMSWHYEKEAMHNAVNSVKAGMSVTRAAIMFSVPQTTLWTNLRRLDLKRCKTDGTLSEIAEEYLDQRENNHMDCVGKGKRKKTSRANIHEPQTLQKALDAVTSGVPLNIAARMFSMNASSLRYHRDKTNLKKSLYCLNETQVLYKALNAIRAGMSMSSAAKKFSMCKHKLEYHVIEKEIPYKKESTVICSVKRKALMEHKSNSDATLSDEDIDNAVENEKGKSKVKKSRIKHRCDEESMRKATDAALKGMPNLEAARKFSVCPSRLRLKAKQQMAKSEDRIKYEEGIQKGIDLVKEGMHVGMAARKVSVCPTTLVSNVKKQKIPLPSFKGYGPKEYEEDKLCKAYQAAKAGMSCHSAARMFSIPVCTVTRHVKAGHKCGKDKLSIHEEQSLVDHIKAMRSYGYDYSPEKIKKMAIDYAVYIVNGQNPSKPLCDGWFESFQCRWPSLKHLNNSTTCDDQEARAILPETVNTYFGDLQNIFDKNDFTDNPKRIYNIDEIVVAFQDSDENKISLIGCGSASGQAVPPYLVFKESNYVDGIMSKCTPEAVGAVLNTEHTTTEGHQQYITNHLLKHALPPSKKAPLLLLYNEHTANISLSLIQWARQQHIILFTLPVQVAYVQPHSEVGCLGPFVEHYQRLCERQIKDYGTSSRLEPKTVVELTCQAYNMSLTSTQLQSSFLKCGIYPLQAVRYVTNTSISNHEKDVASCSKDNTENIFQLTVPMDKVEQRKRIENVNVSEKYVSPTKKRKLSRNMREISALERNDSAK